MILPTVARDCPLCGRREATPILTASDLNCRVTDLRFVIVRCRCGMAYLDPAPARPGDVYPATYDAHTAASGPSRKSRRFALLEEIRPGRLLDVGCGSGRDFPRLSRAGWKVTGVEASPDAAARGREAGHDIRAGSLEEAALPAGSVDVVTFFHVLEHVYDPVATLREARRILAPGGRVLANVPNFDSVNAKLFGEYSYKLDVPRHVNFFTLRTARRAFEQGTLRLRSIRTRAADGDFRRSVKLRLGSYPLQPLDGAIRVADHVINLFRWGEVIEILGLRPA